MMDFEATRGGMDVHHVLRGGVHKFGDVSVEVRGCVVSEL